MVRRLFSQKAIHQKSIHSYIVLGLYFLVLAGFASFSTVAAQVYAPMKKQANTQINTYTRSLASTADYLAGYTVVSPDAYVEAASQPNALVLAEQKIERARQAYRGITPSVDQPLWKDALIYMDSVYRAKPTDLNVLYSATVLYNEVGWDYQAWEFAREYLAAGGVFDDVLIQILTEVGNDLGYSYHEAGMTDSAIAYFEAVSQINPIDIASVQELARIYSEAGFPEDAAAYWQEAVQKGSSEANYFLERMQLELYIGPAAADAFYHGIEHYYEGHLEESKDAFSIAVETNPSFTESWRWLARTLMESCISQDALWAWQNYSELVPNDETASYFIDVVNEQLTWGCEAGNVYMEGHSLYESELLAEANEYFVYAAVLDESYLEANRWAAITYQELGDTDSALYYWYAAYELAPHDETITYFIDVLEGNIDSYSMMSH